MSVGLLVTKPSVPDTVAIAHGDERLERLLRASSASHDRLCPRQVLGVRMALHAGDLLGISVPDDARRLFVFVETDGCFLDGLVAGSGCSVGHRTMYVLDYGKIAATFVDLSSERAVRIAQHPSARTTCGAFAPEATNRWATYLAGYAAMPADHLFIVRRVRPLLSIAAIRSHKSAKAMCAACGEEVINEREVVVGGEVRCTPCARGAYWLPERGPAPALDGACAPEAALERFAV